MNTIVANKYELNNLKVDVFGRPHGILLIDKPVGITSHDVVDKIRHLLGTRKVGHAGALDVFASGLLIILVGNATKLSDELLNKDKSYLTTVVVGVETATQDTEGEVLRSKANIELDETTIQKVVNSFDGGYEQLVSIYSSVKVEGKKLRKVLRDKGWGHVITKVDNSKQISLFNKANPEKKYIIDVPKRVIIISEIKVIDSKSVENSELPFQNIEIGKYHAIKVAVTCSKGTYIRQLAEDIGEKFGYFAALSQLRRTVIGNLSEDKALQLAELTKEQIISL